MRPGSSMRPGSNKRARHGPSRDKCRAEIGAQLFQVSHQAAYCSRPAYVLTLGAQGCGSGRRHHHTYTLTVSLPYSHARKHWRCALQGRPGRRRGAALAGGAAGSAACAADLGGAAAAGCGGPALPHAGAGWRNRQRQDDTATAVPAGGWPCAGALRCSASLRDFPAATLPA